MNEPTPQPGTPDCPDFLNAEARAEWRRIVPELAKLGLLTRVDRAALAAYCACYSRWVEAERMVQLHGLITTAESGYQQKSPWLSIADKSLDQLYRYLQQFGLSPASRTKVAAIPANEDDEFFA